jgi:RimJ/RimL family protein N-acetyltransferase
MIELKLVDTNTDIELLYYWRQNPLIFKNFYLQQAPLKWQEHLEFWRTKKSRVDWIIYHLGRPIGSVYFKLLDRENLDIGIYIGDISLWGQGIGAKVLILAIEWAKNNQYARIFALVKSDNIGSLRMFAKLGFNKIDLFEDDYVRLSLELIN